MESGLKSDQYAYLEKDESPFFQRQNNYLELFKAINIVGSDFRNICLRYSNQSACRVQLPFLD